MRQPGPQARHVPACPARRHPINAVIGGRIAAAIKETVCRGTVWGIRREAAKPGSNRWLKGGKRSERLAREAVTVP
ncbi:dehydrogenase domain protein [Mycobacterium xenopi 3993]|nr:dehydrogenase domain protein [Mycobacterium xenopi 3993]